MASPDQVRGALLEEAILWLLEFAGYRTVTTSGADPTLANGPAGLIVRGRGEEHQIDAIADFVIGRPFSYQQRLLVEGKAYADQTPVGIGVVRNAVGVLKDVTECWISNSVGAPPRQRYSYNYAVFSLSAFTQPAQRYAFAQDIFLVPLARSTYFAPIANAIRASIEGLPRDGDDILTPIREIRAEARNALRGGLALDQTDLGRPRLQPLADATRQVGSGLLAMAGNEFPLFLVPEEATIVETLPPEILVRIRRRAGTWYLESTNDQQRLFSFDVPEELFRLYAENGVLSQQRAIDLKVERLSEIHAFSTLGNRKRVLVFRLDQRWLEELKNQIRNPAP